MYKGALFITLIVLSCCDQIESAGYGDCANLDPQLLIADVRSELDPLLELPENFAIRDDLARAKRNVETIYSTAEECFPFHGNAGTPDMLREERNIHIEKMDKFLDITSSLSWLLLDLDANTSIGGSLLGIEHVWKDSYEEFLASVGDT